VGADLPGLRGCHSTFWAVRDEGGFNQIAGSFPVDTSSGILRLVHPEVKGLSALTPLLYAAHPIDGYRFMHLSAGWFQPNPGRGRSGTIVEIIRKTS
jgi:hypothetical protein